MNIMPMKINAVIFFFYLFVGSDHLLVDNQFTSSQIPIRIYYILSICSSSLVFQQSNDDKIVQYFTSVFEFSSSLVLFRKFQ